jgi:crotonobetainyl-CoA:carnitine CoA-transferase CaiB-like acyl-CoA transferase
LWEGVVRALQAPGLAQDERFASVSARSQNLKALEQALNQILGQHDVDTWIARLTKAGVPVTRVSGLEEAVISDIAQERGTFMASGGVPLVRLPWLADGQPIKWQRPAPKLGEHSLEILAELGYDDAQAAALLGCGAVVAAQSADPAVLDASVP